MLRINKVNETYILKRIEKDDPFLKLHGFVINHINNVHLTTYNIQPPNIVRLRQ